MRIVKPVCIEVVGGNSYRMKVMVRDMEHRMTHHLTYQAEGLAEVGAGGMYAQNRYDILQRLQGFETCLEFTAGPCLFVKKSGDGVDGSAILELLSEWMFDTDAMPVCFS